MPTGYRASAQYQLAQELPAWVDLIANTTVLLGLGALTLATVLLITGPSNRYFRARGPVVLPPVLLPSVPAAVSDRSQ